MEMRVSPAGLDVSADLTELGRTPITVVSAGVKSILDIGRTLEYLVRNISSLSVTQVVSFHRNHMSCPAFWTGFHRP